MKKTTGWLFRDTKGMLVELREFGPREHFPKGGWELMRAGTEERIISMGPLPMQNAKNAIARELSAKGYQLLWNWHDTLEAFFQR